MLLIRVTLPLITICLTGLTAQEKMAGGHRLCHPHTHTHKHTHVRHVCYCIFDQCHDLVIDCMANSNSLTHPHLVPDLYVFLIILYVRIVCICCSSFALASAVLVKHYSAPLFWVIVGQEIVQDGCSILWSAAEASGGIENGELQPETRARGQLQPPHQTGDGGV